MGEDPAEISAGVSAQIQVTAYSKGVIGEK